MSRHFWVSIVAAFIAFGAAVPRAQAQILPEEPTGGGVFDPGFFDVGDTSGGASTLEEGAQRGFADMVRSGGLNRLQTSVAMRNVEEARRSYIDNRLKATQTYFDMKRINNDYRASMRSQPLSFEGYVRLARAQAPERLSVSQLDPFTGSIEWPVILRERAYDVDREVIERLYVERANEIASNKREIQAACDNLLNALQANIELYAQNDYVNAKRFVESLRYEALLAKN